MHTKKGLKRGGIIAFFQKTRCEHWSCVQVRWFGPIYSFIPHAVSMLFPQGSQNKGVLNVCLISELTENNTEILGPSTHTQHLELPVQ